MFRMCSDVISIVFLVCSASSTSHPGGNLVDGLPPVAHTGEVCLALRTPKNKCMAERPSILIFSRCDYTIWTRPIFNNEESYKLSEYPSFIQFHALEQKLLRKFVSKSCSFLHKFQICFKNISIFKIYSYLICIWFLVSSACSTSLPGCDLVDSLPPVAHS